MIKFLKRPINTGKVVIKGKSINRGGDFGLEVSREYTFEGNTFSSHWLQQKFLKRNLQ